MSNQGTRLWKISVVACVVGALSGLFGIGGGVFLVPLLVVLFHFDQHKAQGTSLIALVPPTGLLAFLEYYHAGEVNMKVGLLIVPGIFLGGILGGRIAQKISPRPMRLMFSVFLFVLGFWQVVSWLRR